jgi:hypothetical protein
VVSRGGGQAGRWSWPAYHCLACHLLACLLVTTARVVTVSLVLVSPQGGDVAGCQVKRSPQAHYITSSLRGTPGC